MLKISKLFISGITAVVASMTLVTLVSAQTFPPVQKKLIEAGWERPTASDLLKHQKAIEKAPYDGIVLMLTSKDDAGKGISLQTRVFDPRPLKLSWFEGDIKKLKSFKSDKLTDNFVRVSTSSNTPDWFDDKGWNQVIENWKVAATIAKEGNLKGICFDPEMYGNSNLFNYGLQKSASKHSFDEYRAKTRQRGREIIEAVTSIYPEMVFFTFRMNDINQRYAKNIAAARYNLLPALINGWLDAAPPEMTFVDGGESAYTYSEPEEFLQTANWIRNTGLTLVAPENRQKYRAQVQVSFGIYLDAYSYYKLDSSNSRDRTYALPPLDGSRLNRLKSNINAAVNAADEYVWTWGEHYRWWPTKTKDVLPETWEEILPGTTKVLLDAVHPERQNEEMQAAIKSLIEQGKVVNLLKNNNFADATANTDKPEADWETKNAPEGWSTWQKKTPALQPGTFGVASKSGEDSGNAAFMAGMFEGFFIQGIDVKPGQKYFVRMRARQEGGGVPRLDVRWQNNHGWVAAQKFLVETKLDAKPNEWFSLSIAAIVPEDATKLYVLIGANSQGSSKDKVLFDNVELYKIP